ncbi:hypothetical protein [Nocardia vinacea]|uniref:hypothetical protein n=1 Tax=Nocardia vinacea TaxID=96468 RepID=UPI0002F9C05D|nr:hypothetical protein [Nocardia vinacea]
MSEHISPLPEEPDVHLSVFLHGARFDFAACLAAALIFVREHQTQHYIDAVTVDLCDTSGYPRLPCERLYLGP